MLAYSFRGLVHYHHGGDLGGMQADMVLEEQLRVLYPAGRRKLTETMGGILSIGNLKVVIHSDTLRLTRPYLVQQNPIF